MCPGHCSAESFPPVGQFVGLANLAVPGVGVVVHHVDHVGDVVVAVLSVPECFAVRVEQFDVGGGAFNLAP